MNVGGLLLPRDGAASKADRAPCPGDTPILASIPHHLSSAATRYPFLTWSWGSIFSGSHSRSSVSSDPLIHSILLLGRQTFILLCAPCWPQWSALAELRAHLLPAALKCGAPLLSPRQGPGRGLIPRVHHMSGSGGCRGWCSTSQSIHPCLFPLLIPLLSGQETGCNSPSLFHVPCDLTAAYFEFQNPKDFSAHCRKSLPPAGHVWLILSGRRVK